MALIKQIELWIPVGKHFDYNPQRRVYRCTICLVEGKIGDYHPCMVAPKDGHSGGGA